MKTLLLIGTGGFVGSILRYLLSVWMLPLSERLSFPLGTLAVNVTGSLVIGLLMARCNAGMGYFLLVVGLCGGFTTFSAFSLELVNLIRAGAYGSASLYIAASVCLCALAVWIGLIAGDRICAFSRTV